MIIKTTEPIIVISSKLTAAMLGIKLQTLRSWRYEGQRTRVHPNGREDRQPGGIPHR